MFFFFRNEEEYIIEIEIEIERVFYILSRINRPDEEVEYAKMCEMLSVTMYMNGIFAKEHCKMYADEC